MRVLRSCGGVWIRLFQKNEQSHGSGRMGLNYKPVELLEQEHRDTHSEHMESRPLLVLQGLEGRRRVGSASESGVRPQAIKYVMFDPTGTHVYFAT